MSERRLDVTELLERWGAGDGEAERLVFALVYDELHRLAGAYASRERVGHTLQPTAIVHEAYLRLVGEQTPSLTSRAQFLRIAARLMRQILVNHAVARATDKRGGCWSRIPLDDSLRLVEERSIELRALDEALEGLAKIDPRQAHLVELRFFGGLTIEEAARVLDISPRSVVAEWSCARAWLRKEIAPS